MSATRTFRPLTANTDLVTITAYTNGTKWGYQDADYAREDIDVLSYLVGHKYLGGIEVPMTVTTPATYQPVLNALTYDLNNDTLGSMTLEAVVFYYSSNAGTNVNVRLRNTTDGSNAGTIAAQSNATTVQREVITLTFASGIKTYRLEWTADNATNPVFCWGYLRLRRVPA